MAELPSLLHTNNNRSQNSFQAMGGWQGLSYQVNEVMSPTDPLTALVVNLTGVDPDDAFSTVPYEKGSAFLWYLEDTGQQNCIRKEYSD